MNFLQHWKILLTMLAIFAAGIVTGSMVTVRVVKHVIAERTGPDYWVAGTMREYQHRLALTPEQTRKVQTIMERAGADLRRIRASAGPEIGQIVRAAQEEVAHELTPDQLAKFDELRREQRQRFLERMSNGPPPKGPRPMPPQFNARPQERREDK